MVPFPIPAQNATVKEPSEYNVIVGEKDSNTPDKVNPPNTNSKMIKGLNLSASHPPIGRKSVVG